MVVGICRYKNGWLDQDSVLVRYDDGREMEMSAETYVLHQLEPALEHLPYYPPTDDDETSKDES